MLNAELLKCSMDLKTSVFFEEVLRKEPFELNDAKLILKLLMIEKKKASGEGLIVASRSKERVSPHIAHDSIKSSNRKAC